ncbi:GpE family phage tail protein [Elstera cyanobacteriorum]|uniref:Uncharacterized protein n=1 Tax=Elstera cyanobacteriorum TaxID=2022747 RepID=A0A255XWJ8_9PROT|nr:hypothetical protein CHR90_02415 [Elstera cyanobacteriorum]
MSEAVGFPAPFLPPIPRNWRELRADIAAVFHWQPSEIDALTVDDFLLAHGEAEARLGLMRGVR